MRFLPGMIGALSLSTLFIVSPAGPALADGPRDGFGYHMGSGLMWDYGSGGLIFHWVTILALIGVVVVLLVGAFRAINATPTTSHGHTEGAIDLLKTRFARGEIDRAEYDDKLKTLSD